MKLRALQEQGRTVNEELQRLIRKCKIKGLSERTIEQYTISVERFVAFRGNIGVSEITAEDIQDFTCEISNGLSPGSVNYHLRGIRTFFNYCKLSLEVPMVKEIKKQIIPFTAEQVKALLQQPNRQTFVGMRDYLMMQLLLDTGMRMMELCSICCKDVHKNHILILGKGGKERIVPVGEYCGWLLVDYLNQVKDIPEDQPIFVTVNNLPFNHSTLNKRIKKYAKQAEIEGVRCSCHTFRHTFARLYLLNGGDMFSLRKILGHESLDMVKRYVELFTSDIMTIHRRSSPSDSIFKKRQNQL